MRTVDSGQSPATLQSLIVDGSTMVDLSIFDRVLVDKVSETQTS